MLDFKCHTIIASAEYLGLHYYILHIPNSNWYIKPRKTRVFSISVHTLNSDRLLGTTKTFKNAEKLCNMDLEKRIKEVGNGN